MIPIQRGPEPAKLAAERHKQLTILRALTQAPVSDDITGYRIVADELAKLQNYKCCYCEFKLRTSYNDVEHFRPKGAADRTPGSNERHGYWWLAFCWENLLFACPNCNRSAKKTFFPLANGSTALQAEEDPPGNEIALLLDPASGINPAEHIQYVYEVQGKNKTGHWFARPRNGSEQEVQTIEVYGLNQQALLESRNDYIFSYVQDKISDLENVIKKGRKRDILLAFQRASDLFRHHMAYSLLSYDVLCANFPAALLQAAIKQSWPPRSSIGKL